MAESYEGQIDYYMRYWRRQVSEGAMDVDDLRDLATSLYSVDDAEVTITETGFERGVITKGVVNIPKWAIGAALEALIAELDPDNAPTVPSTEQGTNFSTRCVQV